jgi:hypothetical protein
MAGLVKIVGSHRHSWLALAGLVAMLALVAACGNDPTPSPTTGPTPTPTITPTPVPTPTPFQLQGPSGFTRFKLDLNEELEDVKNTRFRTSFEFSTGEAERFDSVGPIVFSTESSTEFNGWIWRDEDGVVHRYTPGPGVTSTHIVSLPAPTP